MVRNIGRKRIFLIVVISALILLSLGLYTFFKPSIIGRNYQKQNSPLKAYPTMKTLYIEKDFIESDYPVSLEEAKEIAINFVKEKLAEVNAAPYKINVSAIIKMRTPIALLSGGYFFNIVIYPDFARNNKTRMYVVVDAISGNITSYLDDIGFDIVIGRKFLGRLVDIRNGPSNNNYTLEDTIRILRNELRKKGIFLDDNFNVSVKEFKAYGDIVYIKYYISIYGYVVETIKPNTEFSMMLLVDNNTNNYYVLGLLTPIFLYRLYKAGLFVKPPEKLLDKRVAEKRALDYIKGLVGEIEDYELEWCKVIWTFKYNESLGLYDPVPRLVWFVKYRVSYYEHGELTAKPFVICVDAINGEVFRYGTPEYW